MDTSRVERAVEAHQSYEKTEHTENQKNIDSSGISSKAETSKQFEARSFEESAPQIKQTGNKINWKLFAVLLFPLVVPALIYLAYKGITNAMEKPVDAFEHSLLGTMTASFAVGSQNEPLKDQEGTPIIGDKLQAPRTMPLEYGDSKPVHVLKEIDEKISRGLKDFHIASIEEETKNERATLKEMTLQKAASSHPFISGAKKEALSQGNNDAIYAFDGEVSSLFFKLLNTAEVNTAEDYVAKYQGSGQFNQEKSHSFKEQVQELFQKVLDPKNRYYSIVDLLKVEPPYDMMRAPHQQAINKTVLQTIADWAGKDSIEEAFGSLSPSNPVSILQVMMQQHFLDPWITKEAKEMEIQAKKVGAQIQYKRTLELLLPEGGAHRLAIHFETTVTDKDGKIRKYLIENQIKIFKGFNDSPAHIEMHRTGKRQG